jgi:hypothetical protein
MIEAANSVNLVGRQLVVDEIVLIAMEDTQITSGERDIDGTAINFSNLGIELAHEATKDTAPAVSSTTTRVILQYETPIVLVPRILAWCHYPAERPNAETSERARARREKRAVRVEHRLTCREANSSAEELVD